MASVIGAPIACSIHRYFPKWIDVLKVIISAVDAKVYRGIVKLNCMQILLISSDIFKDSYGVCGVLAKSYARQSIRPAPDFVASILQAKRSDYRQWSSTSYIFSMYFEEAQGIRLPAQNQESHRAALEMQEAWWVHHPCSIAFDAVF